MFLKHYSTSIDTCSTVQATRAVEWVGSIFWPDGIKGGLDQALLLLGLVYNMLVVFSNCCLGFYVVVTSDKGEGGKCDCPRCFSVCLLTRLLKNACMDLDEILRVDRCRDMDKLLSPVRIIVRMLERENLKSKVRQTGNSLRSGYRLWDALQRDTVYSMLWSKGQGVSAVAQLFCTTYGCGATGRRSCQIFGFWPIFFVGGTCAPPSALLVIFGFTTASQMISWKDRLQNES